MTDPMPRPSIAHWIPWSCLLAALAWALLLRVPLVANARIHLDSDLAVDGLTLLEAVEGHWRWHYPGTPFSGTIPVLFSLPQSWIWGANPEMLVSGGLVAHLLLMIAVFGLAWRGFGPRVAVWSLVPLTFASTGTLWLSGRITGGHLPVVAWSAAAWLLLAEVLRGRRWPWWAGLGAWSGLGLYLDSMFAMTLGGMHVAVAWFVVRPVPKVSVRTADPTGPSGTRALALILGLLIGLTPAYLGRTLEPHDAYREQFTPSFQPTVLAAHARILVLDCLPRLIAGHRLPGLEADPDPKLLGLDAPVQRRSSTGEERQAVALPTTALGLGLFTMALLALAHAVFRASGPVARAIPAGLLATALAVAAGFLANRNIFNSDNYRYLVLLLIPWALGLGLLLDGVLRRPGLDRLLGVAAVVGTAALFTADSASWYRRLGWIDGGLMPVHRPLDDVALGWLEEHPDVPAILGGYWDVYRLSFLTGGRVRGIPYGIFPNRFPEWSRDLPEGRPETLFSRQTSEGRQFLDRALRGGGEVVFRRGGLSVVHWPWPGRGPRPAGPAAR